VSCPELTRRRFLQWTGAAGLASLVATLAASDLAAAATTAPLAPGTPILVLLTLCGGNDGLNTVVPYTDPAYQSLRSNIALSGAQVAPITGSLALNAAMPEILALYQQNKVAIVEGVSYPNPSLSHFTSMAIWQSASPAEAVSSGWIGRWLDTRPRNPFDAVAVGSTVPPLMAGNKRVGSLLPLGGLSVPPSIFKGLGDPSRSDPAVVADAAGSIADLYTTATTFSTVPLTALSGSGLDRAMHVVSTMIGASVPVRVWAVQLSSFDTHTGEVRTHDDLWAQVSKSIGDFMTEISATPHANDVTVMLYSEFGRRAASNSGLGTDHGTAGPMFLVGNSVKSGLYGAAPSLSALDANGNLVATTDFRDVYAGVAQDVLGVAGSDIMPGWTSSISVH
jgi:uncharacterized protein (DUF1501 family)